MGHLYQGGMWFKKKANIIGYDPNTAVDGTDWRTNGNATNWSASSTLPDAADAGSYFYMPALGYYSSGQLTYVGDFGFYWSSSTHPWGSNYYAYAMDFYSARIRISNGRRIDGFRVAAFK